MTMLTSTCILLITLSLLSCLSLAYNSEYILPPQASNYTVVHLPEPLSYLSPASIPTHWDWANVDGVSYLTKNLNQHVPQYCGSCWAHGPLSSLADRVKIARKAKGVEINLSVQFILNCAGHVAGSCHGGWHLGVYQHIHSVGQVPFDTCLSYEACSEESTEGRCAHGNWECNAMNTCRTCDTFQEKGGKCAAVEQYPNVSIAEFGRVSGAEAIRAEVYARGPVSCAVNAEPLQKYSGGILNLPNEDKRSNHVVSIVGFGESVAGEKYWIVRNSWGEYWGESGFFRLVRGSNQLGLEEDCVWATPKSWTESNVPCFEDGSNCGAIDKQQQYTDAYFTLGGGSM